MELGAGSEIEISFIDQGVKCSFLKIWGKTVKVTKLQGAKQKFTLFFLSVFILFLVNRYIMK
ncbi:hypothetical protein Hanom_Chr13g01242411 [Helianthus anomalus]